MTDKKKPAPAGDPPLLFEPSLKDRVSFNNWVSQRSPEVAEEIRDRKLDPWRLYRMKSTDERVTIIGINEPEPPTRPNLTVNCLCVPKYNPRLAEAQEILNVPPEDLELCAPPAEPQSVAVH